MVPGAIKNNAYLVVACGDLPGKAKAEAYMAARGINSYAPCDRFTANVMGYNRTGVILGGEPVRPLNNGTGAVIGAQPVPINKNELIIVQTTNETYPDQYCDTPYRYFKALEKVYKVKLNMDVVNANIGETDRLVAEVQETGANVIGVRVETEKDKKPVKIGLKLIQITELSYFIQQPIQQVIHCSQNSQHKSLDKSATLFIKQIPTTQLNRFLNQIRSLWSKQTYNTIFH